MLPRWIQVVIAAEVAGLVVLVVLLVHLASGGVQAVGQVVDWARPHIAQSSPAPPAPTVPRAAPSPAGQLGNLSQLGGPLLHQLDKDTEATANGEMQLLARMEDLLRRRIEDAMAATQKGH
jgi:hypothetical protein